MDQKLVYSLHGPDGEIRYIGKSERGLKRPREHGKTGYMQRHAHLPVVRWIVKLRASGQDYSIRVVQECSTREELNRVESEQIANLREQGTRLLNITDGGGGTAGYRHTEATRAKMSETRQRIAKTEQEITPRTPDGAFICEVCNDYFNGKRCLNCKRNYHHERKGDVVAACSACHVMRRLYSNGECGVCLEMAGLRECARCYNVLPQHLSFKQRQGSCGGCRNELRRVRRSGDGRRR